MTCSINFIAELQLSKTSIVTFFQGELNDIKIHSCLIAFQWVNCLRIKNRVLTTGSPLPVSGKKGKWLPQRLSFLRVDYIISYIHNALSYRKTELTYSSYCPLMKENILISTLELGKSVQEFKLPISLQLSPLSSGKSQQMIQGWDSMSFFFFKNPTKKVQTVVLFTISFKTFYLNP